MVEQCDTPAEWSGQDLFDVSGAIIGRIEGLGFPRKKFGATWLLVQTGGAEMLFVPSDQVTCTRDRLVMPYSKSYVESGPAVEQGQELSKTDERRLARHYGLDTGMPNSGCRQGCGLCMAKRRAERSG